MSLDEIIQEARAAGLSEPDIRIVKHQYYAGMLHYEHRHPEPDFHKYGSAVLGIVAHRVAMEYCGETYSRKHIQEIKAKDKGSRQSCGSLGIGGDS